MLQKDRKTPADSEFAKGSVMYLQPEETSHFSLGMIYRATDSTKAVVLLPMIKQLVWLGSEKQLDA